MSEPERLAPELAAGAAPPLFAGRRPLPPPPSWRPTLLVVIDTEEEFDWSAPPDPRARSVENVQQLPRLQDVFDRHGVCPAYLVDHPVATTAAAVSLLRGFAAAGRCEIGAHLHPWVTPPVEEAISVRNSFACNLPPALERAKLGTLTAAIKDAFGTAPAVFKAGVYGVGPHTAGFLAELGFTVDSSVVPFTDFAPLGGQNFQDWTGEPFLTAEGIVEIPLTAGFAGAFSAFGRGAYPRLASPVGRRLHLPGIAARLSLLERMRLTPEGHSLEDMKRLTRAAFGRGERLFMLALHSSSMLPGATRYARDVAERDALVRRIDEYMYYFFQGFGGVGMAVSKAGALLAAQAGGKGLAV